MKDADIVCFIALQNKSVPPQMTHSHMIMCIYIHTNISHDKMCIYDAPSHANVVHTCRDLPSNSVIKTKFKAIALRNKGFNKQEATKTPSGACVLACVRACVRARMCVVFYMM